MYYKIPVASVFKPNYFEKYAEISKMMELNLYAEVYSG